MVQSACYVDARPDQFSFVKEFAAEMTGYSTAIAEKPLYMIGLWP
jgi:hypothetical protein